MKVIFSPFDMKKGKKKQGGCVSFFKSAYSFKSVLKSLNNSAIEMEEGNPNNGWWCQIDSNDLCYLFLHFVDNI